MARIVLADPDVGQVASNFNRNATAQAGGGSSLGGLPPVPGSVGATGIPRPDQTAPSTSERLGQWSEALQAKYGLTNVEVAGLNVRLTSADEDKGAVQDARRAGEYGTPNRLEGTFGAKLTVGALVQELSNMSDPQEMQGLQQALYGAGFYGTAKPESIGWGFLDQKTVDAYTELLIDSARDGRAAGLSWEGYLGLRLKTRTEGIPGITDQDGAGGSGGPQTRTSRVVQEIDPGSATAAFRAAIGRNPSGAELDNFMAHYNSTMKANARVTTTTDDGMGNQSSTVTGGYDEQQAAREAAMEDDDFASYQAVATYMPALQQALRGSVSSGQAEL
jgi:hypothetical protein